MPATAPKLTTGKASGDVKLSGPRFESDFNEHLVWHVVRNEQLWRRQGTHKTKTRGEVRGGGAKPWRQKGTGRARAGSSRSPIWTGGGTTFGPTPRSYGGKVNRKEREGALRSALSLHAGRGSLAILDDKAFDKPSSKSAATIRSSWDEAAGNKMVVVVALDQVDVAKSFRNLEDVTVIGVTDLDVVDVMWGRALLVTESALETLNGKAS